MQPISIVVDVLERYGPVLIPLDDQDRRSNLVGQLIRGRQLADIRSLALPHAPRRAVVRYGASESVQDGNRQVGVGAAGAKAHDSEACCVGERLRPQVFDACCNVPHHVLIGRHVVLFVRG